MKVLIYRQGNRLIGLGHIVRCGAIGDELLSLGHEITYTEHLPVTITADVVLLDSGSISKDTILNIKPITVNIATQGCAKWYANYSLLYTSHLDSEEPEDARYVVGEIKSGLKYIPLRYNFRECRDIHRRAKPVDRILVSMGGGDSLNLTGVVATALSKLKASLEITFVLGEAYTGKLDLQGYPHKYRILRAEKAMWDLMVEHDLGICAMGMTTYEACCVGLPTLNIPISPFHAAIAKEYNLATSQEDIYGNLTELLANTGLRQYMIQHGLFLVDGRGAERVANYIGELAC